MSRKARPQVPANEIIQVNNKKKIDFTKPYKFIYMDWWYEILVAVPFFLGYPIALFWAIKYRLRVVGRENLKILRKKGCITISNHCHYYDTVFANFVVFPRALHTAVAQRNMEVPIVRHLLRIFRAFPIPTKLKGLDMIIQPVGEALRHRHHIHFLPEGNLVLMSQKIHRFHLGAFILSYKHQAPIIPMTYILKPKNGKGFAKKDEPFTFTLVIGKPLLPPPIQDEDNLPKEKLERMADLAANWMEETIALYHQETPANVQ